MSGQSGGIDNRSGTISTGNGDVVAGDKVNTHNYFYGARDCSDPPPPEPNRPPPRLLPYLTDRTDQERSLTGCLQKRLDAGCRRPLVVLILGSDDECVDSFVEQLTFVTLPDLLRANELATAVRCVDRDITEDEIEITEDP
jgi:hypothetical protein